MNKECFMAMWPFSRFNRRTKTAASLPAEVQEYYQSEQRERVGVAWLIALVSLLVSTVVIISLFLGGRWAYRKFVQKPTPKTTSSSEKKEQNPKDTGDNSSTQGAQSDSNSTPNDNSQPGIPSPQTSSSSTSTPQPATNGQNSLVRTGPDEDL